jgi:uncharacterized protein (DUF885 family)
MTRLPSRLVVTWALSLSCCAIGCSRTSESPASAAPAAPTGAAQWSAVRDQLIDEYLKAHPAFAVVAGRHEYDGVLPDWSAKGFTGEIARLHAAIDRARNVPDASLDQAARFDRDQLIARMERDLFWVETAEAPFANPEFYIDWMLDNLDPSPYLTRNYAPLDARMRAYTKYATSIVTAAAQIRANLRTPLSRPLLEHGRSAFKGFADFYAKDVPGAFAEVRDPALQAEFKEANAAAAKAMGELAAWLESQRATATASFALGPEKFARMLKDTEGVTTPLPELEAAGRADLARNQTALREACKTYAPGATMQACMAKMQSNKPTGGAVETARAQLSDLKKFVQDSGFATIPGPEEALVNESPPYNRDNSAYIDIPGPYEKGLPAVYYISPPNPSWSKQVQHDYLPGKADLLFTSIHEVWPGHFLQFLHANRNPSKIAALWVGYAYAEGWAHYTEEMMWEEGYGNGTAETHIGQLKDALLRDVRFLSSIGLHTHGMTVAQSEKMFLEEAYADPGNARQQAARGTYDPAYLNYTLGKLMIRKLRADWVAQKTSGDAKAEPMKEWKAFHDAFLSYGGPPIPLVRKAMITGDKGSLF